MTKPASGSLDPVPVFDDNLGYRWKSTGTPNVALVMAKNDPKVYRPNGDGGIPITLVADLHYPDPIKVVFSQASNPDPASGTTTITHFWLDLKLTNTVNPLTGVIISIVDNNDTPYFDISGLATNKNGSLRHPDRAHEHVDSFNYNALVPFADLKATYSTKNTTNATSGA